MSRDAISVAPASDPEGLSEPPSDPLIGTVLQGTYAIDRRMAKGGMSRIYEAHHLRLKGRRFAIKVLLEELSASDALRARFQREVEAVASIDHPGVVRVFDCGVTPQGWPYMVSERLVGMDLAAWLQRFGRLPVDTVLHVGRHLAEALSTTHAEGVIHRDLKPSNVFLLGDFSHGPPAHPDVKILDFGLSRFLDRDDGLTKTRLVLGTPAYMSPEQARGERGDRLSDVYGLGAVLYAAATGEAPFEGSTPEQTVLSVLSKKAVRPRKLQPDMPEGLEIVIQCAMAREPRDRYPEVGAIGVSLSNLAGRPSPRALARLERAARQRRPFPLRVQLVGLLSASLAWLAASLALSTTSALALLGSGPRLTPVTAAVASALASAALAGVLVAGRQFRREVWPNSARLQTWLAGARRGLCAAVIAYGASTLLVRASQLAAFRDVTTPWRWSESTIAWPGWSILTSLLSLVWGVSFALGRGRGSEGAGGRWRGERGALWMATLASVLVVAVGWSWSGSPAASAARLDGSAARAELTGSSTRVRAGSGSLSPLATSPRGDDRSAEAPERGTAAEELAVGRDGGPPVDAGSQRSDGPEIIDLDALGDAGPVR